VATYPTPHCSPTSSNPILSFPSSPKKSVYFSATPSHPVSCVSRGLSPFVLAVLILNEGYPVPAVLKVPEQLPTLCLRQLHQIYQYPHISRVSSCFTLLCSCNCHIPLRQPRNLNHNIHTPHFSPLTPLQPPIPSQLLKWVRTWSILPAFKHQCHEV
jgi:hypothetical protein